MWVLGGGSEERTRSFATLRLPEVWVSDNATAFTTNEFTEFFIRNGICHVKTLLYHPASNGQVETHTDVQRGK